HNHAPEASRAPVAIANSILKVTKHNEKKIKRARITYHHTEPNSIDDLNIPDNLKKILSDQIFLIKESVIDKLLVFSTVNNVQKLSQSMFWIVGGTFKTVPIFTQLYTIHAQVGFGDNSRVLPLVYVLMTSKREQCYNQMYQDIIDFAEDNNKNLAPEYIISDFEIVAINASKNEFPIKIRQMLSLAFFPEEEIPDAFKEIKEIMPNNASSFVQWFEDNYALGRAHIGLFTLIKELQKEQSKVDADIEAILRGAPKPRPTNVQQKREQRLKTAFDNRECKTRLEYLRGIAHNLTM
ncbi:Uncharacterized protein FWK35_00031288, partial [Aphis craccivora]